MTERNSIGRLRLSPIVLSLALMLTPAVGLGEEATTDEIELLGPLTRQGIETALPDWVVAQMEASPDLEAAEQLLAILPGSEVTVFLGTWCSDSRRLLSRLWRATDAVGLIDAEEFRYIGIDRSKREPAEWVGDTRILLVPTVIVRRDGRELGRIVETAPNGIERDLVAILQGELSGLITGSPEELAAAERDDPR